MNKQDLRVIKTIDIISESFLECLRVKKFRQLTVKDITEKARINRSTFYKYYMDKYDLLDKFVNKFLSEFSEQLYVNFIDLPSSDLLTHQDELKKTLSYFVSNKETYLLLWNSDIDRNIFDEMLKIGEKKMLLKIENNSDLSTQNPNYSELYSKLFLANMMTIVKWWLESSSSISVDELSKIMIHNMTKGVFNTLKSDLINNKMTIFK